MRFRIGKEAFLRGLAPVQSVVETRKTLPVLSHVIIEARPERIALFGTDLDVGITSRIETEVAEAGAVAVSARKLYDITRELPDGDMEIESDGDFTVSIRADRSRFRIKGISKEEFPAPPEIKESRRLSLEKRAFRNMTRRTIIAVSTDQTRYTLNGVLLQVHADDVRAVATDGHRLAMVRLPRQGNAEAIGMEALIPKKAVSEALKILKDEEGELMLRLGENQLVLEDAQHTLTTRLIEGQFPNYEQVVPAAPTAALEVGREDLAGALRRTSAIMGDRAAPTVFDVKAGKLTVSCVNLDLGEAREEIDAVYSGADLTIGFNARYLLDFLGVIDGDRVVAGLGDALSPAVFRPAGDETYSCVVMPMRI
jgi:DNA polymerase III subunit beta